MAWIASGVSRPYPEGWSFHVARRVALSYRRSHNGLFYLISRLVDRLPLDHFRRQSSTAVMANREETWLAGWLARRSDRVPPYAKEEKRSVSRGNASAMLARSAKCLYRASNSSRSNARIVRHDPSELSRKLHFISRFRYDRHRDE